MLLFTTQLFTVMKLFWAVSARGTAEHHCQDPLTARSGAAAGTILDKQASDALGFPRPSLTSSVTPASEFGYCVLHCAAPSAQKAEREIAVYKERSGRAWIRRRCGCRSARGSICLQAPVLTTAMPFCCGTSLHAYDTPSPPQTGCALAGHTSAWPRYLRKAQDIQAVRQKCASSHCPCSMQACISHPDRVLMICFMM